MQLERPLPSLSRPQGICLDKDYDKREIRGLLEEFNFSAHIRSRGEEAQQLTRHAQAKARCWVVERTHSWMNRFRGLLVRWCKKAENYLAMLHLAMRVIVWRQFEWPDG